MQNLTQLLKSTLLQFRKADIDFLYPRDGMWVIWEWVAEQIRARGGRVLTGIDARLEPGKDRVEAALAAMDPETAAHWSGRIHYIAEKLFWALDCIAFIVAFLMPWHFVPRRSAWPTALRILRSWAHCGYQPRSSVILR